MKKRQYGGTQRTSNFIVFCPFIRTWQIEAGTFAQFSTNRLHSWTHTEKVDRKSKLENRMILTQGKHCLYIFRIYFMHVKNDEKGSMPRSFGWWQWLNELTYFLWVEGNLSYVSWKAFFTVYFNTISSTRTFLGGKDRWEFSQDR